MSQLNKDRFVCFVVLYGALVWASLAWVMACGGTGTGTESGSEVSQPDAGSREGTSQDIGAKPETKPVSKRPNILLIIADDFGIDVAADYHDKDGDGKADDGRTYAPTPSIHSVCKRGVRFLRAWSTPLCSSTRATILTGRYGFRTGIGEAIPRNGGIGTKEPTIPRVLDTNQNLGYAHANIGKWHLGSNTALEGDKAPNVMGWSHFSGLISGTLSDYTTWTKVVNGQSKAAQKYATTENVDDAISWLGQQDKQKPWFLWLAFNAPHSPFHLPPKSLHSASNLSGDARDIRQNTPPYFRAMVEAMDTEIGRLLQWLKDKGQLDNTMIVFIGDNGTPAKAVEAPYDTKRAKGSLYEGGVLVPMCAAGPLVKQGGRTSTALVHTVDLFGTLLEASGVSLKDSLNRGLTYDSVSFLKVLQDPASTGDRTWVYTERFAPSTSRTDGQAIRDKQFKLLRLSDATGKRTDFFFDLSKDPLEKTDLLGPNGAAGLSADQKTSYEALRAQLEKMKP